MEHVPTNLVLFHLRTPTKKKLLFWAIAVLMVAAGIYLWKESRYFGAVVLAPLAIMHVLDVAQRQVWVCEDRVEIQHLFTRTVARGRSRLYLERVRRGKWALRMKGRWRGLVLLYADNFKDSEEESRFLQHFQIGEPPSEPAAAPGSEPLA